VLCWCTCRLEIIALKAGRILLAYFDLCASQSFDEWLLILREDLDQQANKGLALLAEIYELRRDFDLNRCLTDILCFRDRSTAGTQPGMRPDCIFCTNDDF
jgi:hypothetical protein